MKLAGFMGHAAINGCPFCNISFQDDLGNKYCALADYSKWRQRTREEHIQHAARADRAANVTHQKEIHTKFGYKSCALLQLDYFVPCQFSVVEPMHNLFLGTAKRFFVLGRE